MLLRSLLLALLVAAGAGSEAEPLDIDWIDATRERAVPVRLYWPAQAAPGQRVPLIVFSHGIGGSRRGYRYLGDYWSAQGYASLHVQHVGSDGQVWLGNPFGMAGRLQAAAQDTEAIARVGDIRFALDQLLKSERGALIDPRRLVAAGHSYGANTTLLLAGAQVARQGMPLLDLHEPRFTAAIVISAPPFYGEADAGAILHAVSIPMLHITATEDEILIPGYRSGAKDRLALFEATGSATKALAVFEGGSHSIFTDRAGTGGVALNPKVKAATKELALAFLSRVFDGQDEALQQWNARHQGILAKWVRPIALARQQPGS